MMVQDGWHVELGFSTERSIEVQPVQEHLSTDTGLLLFRLGEGHANTWRMMLIKVASRTHLCPILNPS